MIRSNETAHRTTKYLHRQQSSSSFYTKAAAVVSYTFHPVLGLVQLTLQIHIAEKGEKKKSDGLTFSQSMHEQF